MRVQTLLTKWVERLAFARSGAAAVEFALVLPVAFLVYVGAAQVADGVMTSRRTTMVAKTLVDLVALQGTTTQQTSTPTPGNAMTASALSALLTSAAALMAPAQTSTLTMTISAVDLTNNPATGVCCSALVRWSYTQGGTLRPCLVQMTALPSNSDYAISQLPSGLLPYNAPLPSPASILIADVSYVYQPIISANIIQFAPTMQRTIYMEPRSTGQVATGTLPLNGTQHGKVCY